MECLSLRRPIIDNVTGVLRGKLGEENEQEQPHGMGFLSPCLSLVAWWAMGWVSRSKVACTSGSVLYKGVYVAMYSGYGTIACGKDTLRDMHGSVSRRLLAVGCRDHSTRDEELRREV